MTEPTYRPRRRDRATGDAEAVRSPEAASSPAASVPPPEDSAPDAPSLSRPPSPSPSAAPSAAHTEFAPGARDAWSLRELLGVLGLTLLISITEALLLRSDAATSLPLSSGVVVRGAVVLVYYSILLAFVWWLGERRDRPFAEAVGLRSFDGKVATLAVAGYLVVVRLAGLAYAVVLYLARITLPGSGVDPTRFFGASVAGTVFTIAVVGFFGPFVEEVAFRGVVFGALSEVLPAWAAIGVSATLFALFHFSMFLFVPTLIAGIGLAMIYRRQGSLWPAVMLHSAYNLTSIILAWVLRGYLGA